MEPESSLFFSYVFTNQKGRMPRVCMRVSTEDDKITQIQGDVNLGSCEIIEGRELALSLRFINIYTYSDLEIFKNKLILHVIRQGLTTELVGRDGLSVTPLTDEIVTELADNTVPLADVLEREYWCEKFWSIFKCDKKDKPDSKNKKLYRSWNH